jgi:hypothetical protein
MLGEQRERLHDHDAGLRVTLVRRLRQEAETAADDGDDARVTRPADGELRARLAQRVVGTMERQAFTAWQADGRLPSSGPRVGLDLETGPCVW